MNDEYPESIQFKQKWYGPSKKIHRRSHTMDWFMRVIECIAYRLYIRIRICLIDDCQMKLISFRLCCLRSDDSILIDVNLWMIETEFIIHHRSLIV